MSEQDIEIASDVKSSPRAATPPAAEMVENLITLTEEDVGHTSENCGLNSTPLD